LDENKVDIISWRVGLCETYDVGVISKEEFLKMYEREFIYKDFISPKEESVIAFVADLMSNTDIFSQHIQSENTFIFDGAVPDKKSEFKKYWIFYLAECLEEGHIDSEDVATLLNGIDFEKSDWTEEEDLKVKTVLDILRIDMVGRIPSAIDFFKNPSFELLMFANDMSETND